MFMSSPCQSPYFTKYNSYIRKYDGGQIRKVIILYLLEKARRINFQTREVKGI